MTTAERRARLATRHRLTAATAAGDPVAVTESLLALHATDPASVYLSAAARMTAPDHVALEKAQYETTRWSGCWRCWRTMFVVTAEAARIVQAAASDAVAAQLRRRYGTLLEQAGVTHGGSSWLDRAGAVALDTLSGPATTTDVQWWTGWSLGETRKAIARLDAQEVDLDGLTGIILTDDNEPVPDPGPWVVLLPALDPTSMGWKNGAWYLGDHATALFDPYGNIGPTVWVDGRIVGGWAQRKDGEIVTRMLEDIGHVTLERVAQKTERMQHAIGDARVTPKFRTPLERELANEPSAMSRSAKSLS